MKIVMNNNLFRYSILLLLAISFISGTFEMLFIFICSLLFHELGHIIFAYVFKVKIRKIGFKLYGICANFEMEGINLVKKIIIYLSGVLFNAIIIVVFSKTFIYFKYSDFIINCNKVLIVFNLLFVYPLDGFNIFNEIIASCFKDEYNNRAFKISIMISLVILLALFIIAVYLKSFALIFIVFVLLYKNIIKIKRRDEEILYKIILLLT